MAGDLKTFVVVNPNSANGATGRKWPSIEAEIGRSIGVFDSGFTSEPRHATEITREAISKGYDMVVSVGGDGTNNEVANGFFDNGAPVNPDAIMAVMPGGTGGDLPKTLKVPKSFGQAANILKTGRVINADLGKLSFVDHEDNKATRYFINIASFGISGEIDEIVNRSSKALGGRISFFLGSLRGLFGYKNRKVKIRIDEGEELERRIFYVAVANGRYFGAGMKVAPDAEVDDGLFDIVIAGDFSMYDTFRQGQLIYSGKHLGMDKIEFIRGKKLVAESDRPTFLDVDGEGPGKLPAEFEIIPGAIKLKVGTVE